MTTRLMSAHIYKENKQVRQRILEFQEKSFSTAGPQRAGQSIWQVLVLASAWSDELAGCAEQREAPPVHGEWPQAERSW